MRKTVDVRSVVDFANNILAKSDRDVALFRQGVIAVVENVLMETKMYNGFKYLTESEVPEGCLPGINVRAAGSSNDDYFEKFRKTDQTRRRYFCKGD